MVASLIAPHGGALILNTASQQEQTELAEQTRSFPQLVVGSRQLADLELLANGAYSPLHGFMTQDDYLSVVNTMHLSNGLPWSIPITLATTEEQANQLKEGTQIALVDDQGRLQAVMMLQEKYRYDKQLEASNVYRTLED